MNKEKFLQSGLLEQYVLGLTEPEEDHLVEEYLRAFPELQEQLDGLQQALHSYAAQQLEPAMLQTPITPPPSRSAGATITSRYQGRFNLALIACLILAAAATLLYRSYAAQSESMSHLQAEYTTLKEICANQIAQEEHKQAIYQLMQAPATLAVLLDATPVTSDEYFAVAYWNPEKEAGWLDPTHLPTLNADEQYYIWADVDEVMVPIGQIAAGTRSPITIAFQDNATSINITRETLGEHEHPNLGGLTASGLIRF